MDRRIYDQMRRVEAKHWWFSARRAILEGEIARLGLAAEAAILEVGCGTGGNLDMLARHGRVQAVEPDEAARAQAASRGTAVVTGGLLPDGLPAFPHAFDLVAAFDVIEHIDDDAAAVSALARLIRPGGTLIATVPAYAWLWSGHDALHHHKRRYRRRAFAGLFSDAGLKVRRATHFNTLLFPAIGAVRLARRMAKVEGSDDETMPGPVLNSVLRSIFAAEKTLLRFTDLPFGVSILVTASRLQ